VTGLEWILVSSLGFIYLALLATVAVITFRKGHIVLGVVGFFLPILWLIGAVLKPKQGSNYDGPL
jgi:hypothetical protein